jgi:prophage maintenance system killer protein
MKTKIILYQTKSGEIEFRGDFQEETLWANLQQIADLFQTDKSGISRHIHNIYATKELKKSSTVAKIATVQKEGIRTIKRNVDFYNLDMIISVGYRVNSKKATSFRQWATKTLRQHITEGYTINKKIVARNYQNFLLAVDDIKKLLPSKGQMKAEDTLELIKSFAATWMSLSAFDKETLPKTGVTKKQVKIEEESLATSLSQLKQELVKRKEASELFGIERSHGSLAGIVGNIFQTFGGQAFYPTIEQKAAHLLYFMVKNHPFVDGNKRSGAFAFIWFLRQSHLLNTNKITPEALAALTLLVAESNPKDKDRMIGLILLLLK